MSTAPAGGPHILSIFLTCVSVFCVFAGTWKISSSCTHPMQTGVVGCGREFTGARSKWFNLVVLGAIAGFTTCAQACAAHCCSRHNRAKESSILSTLFTIAGASSVTVYADYASTTLSGESARDVIVRGVRPCIVCAEAQNGFAHGLIWLGVAIAWVGVVAVVCVAASYPDVVRTARHEQLVNNDRHDTEDDFDQTNDHDDPYAAGEAIELRKVTTQKA